MPKFKCSTLLGVILILVVVVVNSFVGVYYIKESVNTYLSNTEEQLSSLIVSRSAAIENFFASQIDVSKNIANSNILKDYLTNIKSGNINDNINSSYAEEIVNLSIDEKKLEYSENVYITDENNVVVLSNINNLIGKKTDINFKDYIKNTDEAGVSRIISDKYINSGNASIMFYAPIKLDDGTMYYYYKAIDRDFLAAQITDFSLFDKGFICIVDEYGDVLPGISFDTVQDLDILCKGMEMYLLSGSNTIVKSVRENGSFKYSNNTVSHTAYYSTIMNANMTYVISIPTKTLDTMQNGLISRFNIAMIIITILLIFLVMLLISNIIEKPILEINRTIDRILKNKQYERVLKGNTSSEMSQLSIGINQLVSKFRAEIEELSSFRERYRVISENSKDITFEWNLTTGYLYYSNEWEKRFSGAYPKTDLLKAFLDLDYVHPNDLEIVEKSISIMKSGTDTQTEFRIKDASREYKWLLTRTTTIKDSDGKPEKVVGIMIDINKLKTSQIEFMNKAMYDRLTGLYNMESFEFKIADELETCKASGIEMGVVFIDIDDFKHFNDEYGHEVGNEVLIYVANTLSEIAVPNNGFAARFGGDEFLMCIKGVDIEKKIVSLAEQFLESVHELDSELLNKKLSISCSIGISLYPHDAQTAKDLVKKSDAAMYKIKRDGKDGVVLFDENMMK